MNPTNAKKRAAAVGLALALALALPGSALAATSGTVSETLSIGSDISITGLPASIAYGQVSAGGTAEGTVNGIAVYTNDPNGLTLTLTASDLARTGGGGTIAKEQRSFSVSMQSQGIGMTFASVTAPFAGGAFVSYTGPVAIGTSSGAIDASSFAIKVRVAVPTDAVPGDYTGTLTLNVAIN